MPIPITYRLLNGLDETIRFTTRLIQNEYNRRNIYDYAIPWPRFRFFSPWILVDIKNSVNNIFKWFI